MFSGRTSQRWVFSFSHSPHWLWNCWRRITHWSLSRVRILTSCLANPNKALCAGIRGLLVVSTRMLRLMCTRQRWIRASGHSAATALNAPRCSSVIALKGSGRHLNKARYADLFSRLHHCQAKTFPRLIAVSRHHS